MKIIFMLCITLALTGSSVQSQGVGFRKPRCWNVVCPSFGSTVDFTSEVLVNGAKKRTVTDLWANTSPVLTTKGMKMKNVVLRMNKEASPIWNSKAFVMSVWTWELLPYSTTMPPPSLCPYAQIISATLAWERNKDSAAMASALDALGAAMVQNAMLLGNQALRKAGCTAPVTTNTPGTCAGDGAVYQINDMWNLKGMYVPCAYETAAKDMYGSSDYSEKVQAVMATASLSEAFSSFVEDMNMKAQLEMLAFQYAPILDPCCCAGLMMKLTEYYAIYTSEASKIVTALKTKYRN